MIHDVVRYGVGHYACSVCEQRWKTKPTNSCPGVKVYDRYGDHGLLFDKGQLGQMGYRTAEEFLPPPQGCYYTPSSSHYHFLYDPIQAIPKAQRGQTKAYMTDIPWPLRSLPLLETLYLSEISRDRKDAAKERQLALLRLEMTMIAASMLAFTPAEREQMAGYIIALPIPPTLVHRLYPIQGTASDADRWLFIHLLTAYRKHRQNTIYV